jgi:hypothetical protein
MIANNMSLSLNTKKQRFVKILPRKNIAFMGTREMPYAPEFQNIAVNISQNTWPHFPGKFRSYRYLLDLFFIDIKVVQMLKQQHYYIHITTKSFTVFSFR